MLLALLYFGQRGLLYFPDSRPPDAGGLAAAGLKPLSVTADGLQLTSWYAPPAGRTLSVVRFHGNAGHHGQRLSLMRPFLEAGYGVVLVAYPGYGGNPGSPSEASFHAVGRATLDALAAHGLPAERLVLFGESLGSGVATALAVERRVAGVILQAPFTSVADRAQEIYFFVPAKLLVRDRFDNLSRIARLGAPLLIVHGERDATVPAAHGRRLLAAAREPKRGIFVASAGHNDLESFGLAALVLDFLKGLER